MTEVSANDDVVFDAKLFTFQQLVNGMTNHENTLWSRAGNPGLAGKDVTALLACEHAHPAYRRLSRSSDDG